MTAAALTPAIEYMEDGGSLSFPVPFRFLAAAHLEVKRILTDGTVVPLAYGTAWSASGGTTDDGGTLTLTASIAGSRLKIRRATPRSQATDYDTNDTFPAETHEQALDRQMLISQEQDTIIADTASRAPLVPEGESAPGFATLSGLLDGDLLQYSAGKFRRLDRSPFAGKFYAGDASGRLVPAAGTGGGDAALRGDLANPAAGAALVAKGQTSVAEVLPLTPDQFGAVGSPLVDDTSALVAASTAASAIGAAVVGAPGKVYYVKGDWTFDCSIDGGTFVLTPTGSMTLAVAAAGSIRRISCRIENGDSDQNRRGLTVRSADQDTDNRKGIVTLKVQTKDFWYGIYGQYLESLYIEPGSEVSGVCADNTQYQQGLITCVHTDLFHVNGATITGGVVGILSGAGIKVDIYSDNVIKDTIDHGIYSSSPANAVEDPTVVKDLTVMSGNKLYNIGGTGLKCFSNGVLNVVGNTINGTNEGVGIIAVAGRGYVIDNVIIDTADAGILQAGKEVGAGENDFDLWVVKGNVIRGGAADGIRIVDAATISEVFLEDNDVEVDRRPFVLVAGTLVDEITSSRNRWKSLTTTDTDPAFLANPGGATKITSDGDYFGAGTIVTQVVDVSCSDLRITNATFEAVSALRLVRNRLSGGVFNHRDVKAFGTYTGTPLLTQDGGTPAIIPAVPGSSGWAADSGTAKKTANTTYSGTAEVAYTQATIQSLMNAVRDISQTQKAMKDALLGAGMIGA